jgi:predicted RNase H-like HicB family nuclease
MSNWEDPKNELLEDPEVLAEYDRLMPLYKHISKTMNRGTTMTLVYPVIISPKESDGLHLVTVPDLYEWGTGTSGRDIADAMYMARDLIGCICIDLQDEEKPLPPATPLHEIKHNPGDIVTLIDVNLTSYRKMNEQRDIRVVDTLEQWHELSTSLVGYRMWQSEFDSDSMEGFHVWFGKRGSKDIEVITFEADVQGAIKNFTEGNK